MRLQSSPYTVWAPAEMTRNGQAISGGTIIVVSHGDLITNPTESDSPPK
jgi:hypothetical protein